MTTEVGVYVDRAINAARELELDCYDISAIRFSACCALYWYCAEYHEGQGSIKYSLLSRLGYTPGALMSDIFDEDDSDGAALYEWLTHNWEGEMEHL